MNKLLVGAALLAMLASQALAHGKGDHEPAGTVLPPNLDMVETAFGHTGDPQSVDRTVDITATDEFVFEPPVIRVSKGETVRIRLANVGETLHELVIGTAQDLQKHAELMERFPYMEHADPFMAHADAGQTAQIVWTFSRPGRFEFGCLIPGHFEAGMRGVIEVANQ